MKKKIKNIEENARSRPKELFSSISNYIHMRLVHAREGRCVLVACSRREMVLLQDAGETEDCAKVSGQIRVQPHWRKADNLQTGDEASAF